MGQNDLAEPDADGEEALTRRPLQAAAIAYRIAFGPRAGQKVLTLRGRAWTRARPCGQARASRRARACKRERCLQRRYRGRTGPASHCAPTSTETAQHAAVRVEAHDRKRLEPLCRYITRPSLSDGRAQLKAAGQVEL